MLTAMSIDPGVTTGFCVATITKDKVKLAAFQDKLSENDLYTLLVDTYAPDHLIYESFNYRNKSRAGLELMPRNLIGVIQLYGQRTAECKLYEQSPAEVKSFWTTEKLTKMELNPRGKQHARDAVRHFMHWFMFKAGAQYNTKQPIIL